MKLAKDIQTTGAGMTASELYRARRIAGTRSDECLAHGIMVSPKEKMFFKKHCKIILSLRTVLYIYSVLCGVTPNIF